MNEWQELIFFMFLGIILFLAGLATFAFVDAASHEGCVRYSMNDPKYPGLRWNCVERDLNLEAPENAAEYRLRKICTLPVYVVASLLIFVASLLIIWGVFSFIMSFFFLVDGFEVRRKR